MGFRIRIPQLPEGFSTVVRFMVPALRGIVRSTAPPRGPSLLTAACNRVAKLDGQRCCVSKRMDEVLQWTDVMQRLSVLASPWASLPHEVTIYKMLYLEAYS